MHFSVAIKSSLMQLKVIFAIVLTCVFCCCTSQGQPKSESIREEKLLIGDTVEKCGSEIRAIFEDKHHILWIGTQSDGLFKIDGKTIVQFTTKHGLTGNSVWKITADSINDILCIKTSMDYQTFDGKSFQKKRTNTINQLPKNFALLDNSVFDSSVMYVIDLPKNSPFLVGKSLNNYEYDVYSSVQDKNGVLYFGTCTAGLCIFDGQQFIWYNDKELCAPIRTMLMGKDGTLWIGNNGVGLIGIKGNKLTNYSKKYHVDNPDYIHNLTGKPGTMSRVWSIVEDKNKTLWVATIDAGIWKLKNDKLRNYTTKDGLPTDSIWILFEDSRGRMIIGTDGFGLYEMNGKKIVPFRNNIN